MRLFIAIELPGEVKGLLAGLQTAIHGARWVPMEQLHLTLSFLGEVNDVDREILIKELLKISAACFDLRFSLTGCFPNRRQPRVLWIGVEQTPRLTDLAEQVRKVVLSCSIPQEERRFSPHITLARLKQSVGKEVTAFLEQHQRPELPSICAREFILFQSRLTPQGAIHVPVRHFPLRRR